eukprot:TRINITY_DN12099_c0_g3_i2.p1 TRINITY_DN12099_c0_g3~~TRINITY_DN12099_c0_g3_i2.p1  ORF type:complete len:208 (+),score=49.54 TRINITY_DN12099_c0_g3_i2:73-696(+)
MHECNGCTRELPAASFGKMQLKKGPGVMKCKDCVLRGPDVVRREVEERAALEKESERLAEETERSRQFLDENKAKDGVNCLPSGLQYRVLEQGKGKFHPVPSSRCECHYVGRLLDGTQFDSSCKAPIDGPRLIMPAVFAPEDVILAWAEAMQLMVVGDRWELFVPPELGYGDKGSPPKIPGGAVLIFELEIAKITGGRVEKKEESES